MSMRTQALKTNVGMKTIMVSNVKSNTKIGVSTIKMESHVAPKSWTLSMDGWRKVTLRDLRLTITSICSTRTEINTGISLKNINGSFLPQHYTILMELIKNANFSILKQDGISNAQHIIQCQRLLSS